MPFARPCELEPGPGRGTCALIRRFEPVIPGRTQTMHRAILASFALFALPLAACGQTIEQRAATGALAGAVVAGPVGAAVGGVAGTAVGQASRPD